MAQLDHASFQLTPTRTRCDLVIFYGGSKSEKLASGLFQPFVDHLKSLKDEISRGGYSITLAPPTTKDAYWFTKPTFQRFVRFVSTPAVLERFVSIEREILQIESSVQLQEGNVNDTRKSDDSLSSQKNGESEEAVGAVANENSKAHLQRLLGTRLALLRKEQAMAYARGLVAGFEIHNLDALIMFADAFGALRLREACISFRELHKKKHSDGLWREELAAVAAYSSSELQLPGASGIVMASETPNQNIMLNLLNGGLAPSHDSGESKTDNNTSDQVPMAYPNQNPQYFYGLPPYHGYPFPNMQSFPPHYQSNMQWPPGMDEASYRRQFDYRRPQRSSSRSKKNYSSRKESDADKQTDSSDSTYTSENDSDTQQEKRHTSVENSNSTKKKSKKKSSRKVVIQNINYITPKRKDGNKGGVSDGSLSDEGVNDGDSHKQTFAKAEELLMALHDSQERDSEDSPCVSNGSDHVNTVLSNGVEEENFIMRSSNGRNSLASKPTVEFEFEEPLKKPTASPIAADPLVMIDRNGRNDDTVKLDDFRNEVNFRSGVERKDGADEDKLFSQRSEEPGTGSGHGFSTSAAQSTVRKSWRGGEEDWFSANNSVNPENQMTKQTVFDGDCVFTAEKNNQANQKGMCIDDSFFIQSRSAVDDTYASPWKTEDADLSLAEKKEIGSVDTTQDKQGMLEPDDLYMVLERESSLGSNAISWPVDYGADLSFQEADRIRSTVVKTPDNTADKKPDVDGTNANPKKINKVTGTKARPNELRKPIGSNRFDIRSKKASPVSRPVVHKSKQEKEEETRKRMEEMAIERQKRIAEKTAAAAGLAPARRSSLDSQTAKGSMKNDRTKLLTTKRTSLPM